MKRYPNSRIDYTKYLEAKPKGRRTKNNNGDFGWWHVFGTGLLKDIPKKHSDRE